MPMLLLAAMCLPAFIIAAVAVAHRRRRAARSTTPPTSINVQVVIPSSSPARRRSRVSRDLRFRVVPLYFSRPLERVDYVRAKFAAMATALFVLTRAAARPVRRRAAGEADVWDDTPDFLTGAGRRRAVRASCSRGSGWSSRR